MVVTVSPLCDLSQGPLSRAHMEAVSRTKAAIYDLNCTELISFFDRSVTVSEPYLSSSLAEAQKSEDEADA